MLCRPKSACSAPADHQMISTTWRHLKGNYDLNSAFENANRLQKQKPTGSQFHYIVPLTL
jgi:hypothetical protein